MTIETIEVPVLARRIGEVLFVEFPSGERLAYPVANLLHIGLHKHLPRTLSNPDRTELWIVAINDKRIYKGEDREFAVALFERILRYL